MVGSLRTSRKFSETDVCGTGSGARSGVAVNVGSGTGAAMGGTWIVRVAGSGRCAVPFSRFFLAVVVDLLLLLLSDDFFFFLLDLAVVDLERDLRDLASGRGGLVPCTS